MSGRRRGRPAKGVKKEGIHKRGGSMSEPEETEKEANGLDTGEGEVVKFPEMESPFTPTTTGNGEEGAKLCQEQFMASPIGRYTIGNAESNRKWSDLVEEENATVENRQTQQQNKEDKKGTEEGMKERSWAEVVQDHDGAIPYSDTTEIEGIKMGAIKLEEVEQVKQYWGNVLVCKVIGSSPPFMIMNGFLNRMWRNRGLEKVWQMERGVFMAKFKDKGDMEAACRTRGINIDGKPILCIPWSEKLNLSEIEIPAVPVWIQLPKLELKYWSPTLIGKIVSSIGKPIKVDSATLLKERLQYARVLVEVSLKEEVQDHAVFLNEMGQIMHQKLIYEWQPLVCRVCKGFGHGTDVCRKAVMKQVYRPKLQTEQRKEANTGIFEQAAGGIEEEKGAKDYDMGNGSKHTASDNVVEQSGAEQKEERILTGINSQSREKERTDIIEGSTSGGNYMIVQRRKNKHKVYHQDSQTTQEGGTSGMKGGGLEDKPPDHDSI